MLAGQTGTRAVSRRTPAGARRPRVAFVTNFCSHYRVAPFELLARDYDIDYYFFSDGGEWYWRREHGVRGGAFRHRYLPGFRLGNTRISPHLPLALLQGDYDVFVKCINGRFALPMTYALARLRRRPFVLWTGIWTRIDTAFHRLAFPLVRHVYRQADAVVAYGEHVRGYLEGEGVARPRIFLADQAVDNARYQRVVSAGEHAALRARLALEADQPVVLYVGRLTAVKGLRHLLEAFRAVTDPRAVLVLAGEGEDREALRALAQTLGLAGRVRFTGYVAPEATTAYYAIAQVAVLPSVTMPAGKELWGLVVNEAFNQGLPVIASDAVGAAAGGLLRHDVNGLVVPERDAPALAAALNRVLGQAEIRARLGRSARQTIEQWTPERMVAGFRAAIEHVHAR
jgi:glycosyltransferase involved in cell wall biosynthesis